MLGIQVKPKLLKIVGASRRIKTFRVFFLKFLIFAFLYPPHYLLSGAGLGTFLTYATFMRRSQGAVKLGSMTPFFNNIVSLMCGVLVFSTVFAVQKKEGMDKESIVGTLQENGDGNTGLTFIW